VRGGARRLIRHQHFEHALARALRTFGGGLHLHARRRPADAGGGEGAFALDLDHASPAIAVGAIAGFGRIAEMRDLDAEPPRHLPDRLARLGFDLGAVEGEFDRRAHCQFA